MWDVDFMNNFGVAGGGNAGFKFYNRTGASTSSILATIDSNGMAMPNAKRMTLGNLTATQNLVIGNDYVGGGNANNDFSVVIGNQQTGGGTSGTGTNAWQNTIVGSNCAPRITTGAQNAIFGYGNASNLLGGYLNTIVGYNCGTNITTGFGNTLIGSQGVANGLTTGSYNTYIGSGASSSSGTSTNEIVIGNAAGFSVGKGNNTFYVTGGASYQGNNLATWTIASDVNIKENIQNIDNSLAKVLKLRPVSYKYKENQKSDIGFIAQEYELLFPEQIVHSAPNEFHKTLGLEEVKGIQQNLIPYLIKAIQEQQLQIEELKATVQLLVEKVGLVKLI